MARGRDPEGIAVDDIVTDLAAARVLTGVKGVGRLVLRKDNDAGADDGGMPW